MRSSRPLDCPSSARSWQGGPAAGRKRWPAPLVGRGKGVYNNGVNPTSLQPAPRPPGLSPALLGTACCVASALGYTAANICMRKLADLGVDPMWATCMKEAVTVAVVGPYLAVMALRGDSWRLPYRWLALLVLVGLATQLGGNLAVQWAFGIEGVGIAVTIPAIFGVMLTASAVLGLVLLGESVSRRSAGAIALLILAIVLLSSGAIATSDRGEASDQKPSVEADPGEKGLSGPWLIAAGVGAACLAGGVYALLTIVIRTTGSRGVPVSRIVFVITAMGVLSLGSLSLARLGPETLRHTPPEHLAWMLSAGVFNLLAFLAITKGLQLTTVVHANVLNGSQIAMGAVAGIFLFRESLSAWPLLGICLTIVGVVLIGQPQADEREVPGV